MKLQVTSNQDIQLLAMMVEKLLDDDHNMAHAPSPKDYRIEQVATRWNGSTDVTVSLGLSRGLAIEVTQHWWGDGHRNVAAILEAATEMSEKIAAIHRMRQEIIDMTAEVRAAASREIANGRRRGLPFRLLSVTPVASRHRISDIGVDVVFERLSRSLRPECETLRVDCAEDVVAAFESTREEQNERKRLRADLDAVGATGKIDSVVVNAMQKAGINIPDVLKSLAATDDWFLDVANSREGERGFRLHWNGGEVYAHIMLADDLSWHQGMLNFKNAPIPPKRTKGRMLRDVVGNPIFSDKIRIRSAYGEKDGPGSFSCTQDLLHFDAETGRLWAA